MLDEKRLAEIEAEHVPDGQIQATSGLLWCASEDCHQDDISGAVHVDWPCDAAQLVVEVRRLRALEASSAFARLMDSPEYRAEVLRRAALLLGEPSHV